jgi:hypothetical protein
MVFGKETVWRYHAVLREPVVGTARQPAADRPVGVALLCVRGRFPVKDPNAVDGLYPERRASLQLTAPQEGFGRRVKNRPH